MPGPDRIEGYAIVSADDMIADASGVQPDSLRPAADRRFFFDALAGATAVVHGAHSAEEDAGAARRPRLIATRRVRGVEPSPDHPQAVLWNPAGTTLDEAWRMLGLAGGTLAVVGGTEIFGLFLPRYGAFHLSRLTSLRLPRGRAIFPGIPPETAEGLLRAHGLSPDPAQALDPSGALTLTVWRR